MKGFVGAKGAAGAEAGAGPGAGGSVVEPCRDRPRRTGLDVAELLEIILVTHLS